MNLQHSILSLRVFFFFPPLESSPEAAPWMEKPRIFPGGLVSLDEKPCNSSRHLCFVRLFSFVSLRLCTPGYSFSLELPGFVPSPPSPFFFSLLAMLARLVKTPKEPRGNVFEAKKLCKNLSVLFCSPSPRLLLFAFYTRLCFLDFWIFEKPRCKSKFSSELRLKFQMFRNWWYLDVEDLNDWWHFNRLTMTIVLFYLSQHVWLFYLLLYLFDYTS